MRGFLVGHGGDAVHAAVLDVELDGGGLQDLCDEGGHQVGTVLAHADDVAGVQATVSSGDDDGPGGRFAAELDLLAAGLPVEVLVSVRVRAAEHDLCAVDEGGRCADLGVDGLGAQTGAFRHDVVFYGEGGRLHVHAFAEVGGDGFHGLLDLALVRGDIGHVQEIRLDLGELVIGLLLFLQGFADSFAEQGLDLALRAHDGHCLGVDQAGNLADRLLFEDKRLNNHSNFSYRLHKFSVFFVTLTPIFDKLYGRAKTQFY